MKILLLLRNDMLEWLSANEYLNHEDGKNGGKKRRDLITISLQE